MIAYRSTAPGAPVSGSAVPANSIPNPSLNHHTPNAHAKDTASAGLTGADMRLLRGAEVRRRHGGVVVVVAGSRARVVPVLARYQGPLLAAAAFAGEGFLTGGDSPSRRNVTNGLVASVAGGADLPRIELGRPRATWLATHAAALGLPALFAAAGFSHSQHVGDVVARLPVPEEAEVVRLLGAGP